VEEVEEQVVVEELILKELGYLIQFLDLLLHILKEVKVFLLLLFLDQQIVEMEDLELEILVLLQVQAVRESLS
jgi:hypothetical protein